ncbi:MAG TPA: hypothetical protein VG457_04460, partial [Planctomycetota bacterium]|nr:hypothetical protein [Planctomycetota bacterium]
MKTLCSLALLAALGAPPEADVQGLYEGILKDDKLEARVVAMGKETYKVYVREVLGDGKVSKAELDGTAEGETISFKNKG